MSASGSLYRSFIVTAVIQETTDARSYELVPEDGLPVIYDAGQFITLVFRKGDKEDRRSYSFSSAPVIGEPIRITVKRIPNGEYSRQLIHNIRPGDKLISSGIAGFFQLPEQLSSITQFVFLAAGSGITPVFSLIKTLLHTSEMPILLIYSSNSVSETIFYRQLEDLHKRFSDRFKIEFLFSHAEKNRRRFGKFLLYDLLEQYNVPLYKTLFYMCGPENYMLTAAISLISAGVPSAHLKRENFNTRQHSIKPVPPDTDAHEVTIFINDNTYQLKVQYPDTILSAAKRHHILLPYSCEAGNCGSCTASCISGTAWMAYNEVLTDDEIRKGKVLTCQAHPIDGDLVIRF